MKNSIQIRLVGSFGLCILLMIAIVGLDFSALQKLKKLYQDSVNRTSRMESIIDAQLAALALHVIIARAALEQSTIELSAFWTEEKKAVEMKLQKAAAAAVTPLERAKVEEARVAIGSMISVCEQEMFPLVEKGESSPELLAEIDARIDRQTTAVTTALQEAAQSMSDQNQQGVKEFYAVLAYVIRSGLTISLIGVAIALSISTLITRRIGRSLSELTWAALQMEKGSYQVELRYQSDDELGALAKAFRRMAEQVQNRAVQLQETNKRLEHEISEHKQTEEQLQRAHHQLDIQVKERTAELSRTNELLRQEISIHKETEEALRKSEARLRDAQRMAHIGNWELDLVEGRLWWSEEIFQIFEIDPKVFGASYKAFLATVHPEDRTKVDRAYTTSVKNKTP